MKKGQIVLCVGDRYEFGTTPIKIGKRYTVCSDGVDRHQNEDWVYVDTFWWYPKVNFISLPDEIDLKEGKS